MSSLKFFTQILVVFSLCGAAPRALAQDEGPPDIFFDPVASNLTLPVSMAFPDDGSGWMYAVEQVGRLRVFDGRSLQPLPFLDLRHKVACCGEDGLLDVAFHPRYAENRFFYVSYVEDVDGVAHTVIARYEALPGGRLADPDSEVRLFHYPRPTFVHNSGELEFGPDGYLYISSGDGGASNLEEALVSQRTDNVFGKILRIDVDGGEPYGIPPTNPLVGVEGAREEIWAMGLRNPWRFSFDRLTGDLWLGDVGSGLVEEIDRIPAATDGVPNFGWPHFEGNGCSPIDYDSCMDDGYVFPTIAIERQETACAAIAGGVRYRGTEMPMAGRYFFADWCTGEIWAATEEAGVWEAGAPLRTRMQVSTFGQDRRNELYLADHNGGVIYRVRATWPQPTLSSASPAVVVTGGDPFRMVVSGSGFGVGSQVLVGDMPAPTEFLNPERLAVTVDPSDIDSNDLRLTVVNPDPNDGPSDELSLAVLLPSDAPPMVMADGVVHAATFRADAVSPGQTVSIFGESLAAATEAVSALPLPTSLGGATVRLADGTQAPLLFASPSQINFLIPWETPTEGLIEIQVESGGVRSEPVALEAGFVNPGVFTINQSGSGQAAALIAGAGVLAAPEGTAPGARPVLPGEYVELYVTGLGAVFPQTPVDDAAVVLSEALEIPSVFVGGISAEVLFAGRAPGFVGLYQVNFRIPEDARAGSVVALMIAAKGVDAPPVSIAVGSR